MVKTAMQMRRPGHDHLCYASIRNGGAWQMAFWNLFFSKRVEPTIDARRRSMSIDASGPEFADRYPTKEDIRCRIAASAVFRAAHVDWLTDAAHAKVIEGAGLRCVVELVVGAGETLSKERRKELGTRRKVGSRFLDAVETGEIDDAADEFEVIIHTASSRAVHLHALRRMEDAGISHCKLLGPDDERSTATERDMDGKRLTIAEGRILISEHEADIRRSAFIAIVE